MLTLLATMVLSCAEPQGSPLAFTDFSSDLDRTSFVLVVGTLGKVTEGRKDRLKAGEGNLDEGGVSASISGTVFSKVQASAKLDVGKALHGTKETALAVTFDMQHAKLNDGAIRRHFLLTPRVALDDGMLGLWFLERDKGKLVLSRVVRLDPKQAANADTFRRLCEDLYTLNVRIHELKGACDIAMRTKAADKAGAIAVLQKALASKATLLEAASERWKTSEVAPLEAKARKLLEDLGVRPASRPSDDDPGAEGWRRGDR